jgi:hypothetical protein
MNWQTKAGALSFLLTAHRSLLTAFCLLLTVYGSLSCSVPVIESPECQASRESVKRFYSLHFGSDMKPTAENLEARKGYLTDELETQLQGSMNGAKDYFTNSENYPKAFQVGTCKAETPEKTDVTVLLYWRENEQNYQREVTAELLKRGDKWLINKVTGN